MNTVFLFLALFIVWWLLQVIILPRMGINT